MLCWGRVDVSVPARTSAHPRGSDAVQSSTARPTGIFKQVSEWSFK
uniref:Alternative protein AHR n=1 Tax=Homo sapiens TaxID=9606 RepID=L0R578_HUMAN|nr:alternative protein AHR [Homo sapiens]